MVNGLTFTLGFVLTAEGFSISKGVGGNTSCVRTPGRVGLTNESSGRINFCSLSGAIGVSLARISCNLFWGKASVVTDKFGAVLLPVDLISSNEKSIGSRIGELCWVVGASVSGDCRDSAPLAIANVAFTGTAKSAIKNDKKQHRIDSRAVALREDRESIGDPRLAK